MGAKVNNDNYVVLYEKLKNIGFKEETEIEEMIEHINEFANIIIDIYLQYNET